MTIKIHPGIVFGTDEHLVEILNEVVDSIDTPMGRIKHAHIYVSVKEVIDVLQKRVKGKQTAKEQTEIQAKVNAANSVIGIALAQQQPQRRDDQADGVL